MQLEPADRAGRVFALQPDEARGGVAVGHFVDEFAVEKDADRGTRADDFEAVPFAERVLDVLRSAVAFHIGPVGIAVAPVDPRHRFAFGGKSHFRCAFRPDRFAVAIIFYLCRYFRRGGRTVAFFRRKNENVPRASLDELGLDAAHPGVPVSAIGSEGMEQKAAVPRAVGTVREGALVPAVIDHEMVVAVGLLRPQVAHAFAADLHDAVFADRPDLFRIVRKRSGRIQVRRESRERRIGQEIHNGVGRNRRGALLRPQDVEAEREGEREEECRPNHGPHCSER